jgi:hypothetical protein
MNAAQARAALARNEERLANARTPFEAKCAAALVVYHKCRVCSYERKPVAMPELSRLERVMLSRWYSRLFTVACVILFVLLMTIILTTP